MSKVKKSSLHVPTQLYELDELLNVVRTLYSMDQFSEREARIIQRAVGVYRELIIIDKESK